MKTVYVIVTDARSWGKGDTILEAFIAAMEHGGDPREGNVFQIEHDTADLAYVDQMGSINTPKGAKVRRLTGVDLVEAGKAWRRVATIFEDIDADFERHGVKL